jgi:putative DNA primase/helicase
MFSCYLQLVRQQSIKKDGTESKTPRYIATAQAGYFKPLQSIRNVKNEVVMYYQRNDKCNPNSTAAAPAPGGKNGTRTECKYRSKKTYPQMLPFSEATRGASTAGYKPSSILAEGGNKSTAPKPSISLEEIQAHCKELIDGFDAPPERKSKGEILTSLIEQCTPIDFTAELHPTMPAEARSEIKVKRPEMKVLIIDEIIRLAEANNWSLCKQGGFCYLYNGAYWETLAEDDVKHFLSDCAAKLGVKQVLAKDCQFVDDLYKQFLFSAFLQPPEFAPDKVLINLENGTFEVTTERQELRSFNSDDFLTYQLPFRYDAGAGATVFKAYLDRVLPDKRMQDVLSEYAGYSFIRHGSGLKLEKCLILYGNGANGKSVFFEVLTALLGRENVSSYPLSDLTDKTGYYRAEIANKLLNYASEISREMNCDLFKKMASGEPFTARSPYGKPFEVMNYAKMIFNANELPRDTEQTTAFFRRFIIIPFNVTIPPEEQDRELHRKIIDGELAGVFNWVLDGLKRLLSNKKFTDCPAIDEALNRYRTESDSVQLFLEENNYQQGNNERMLLKELYLQYKTFCLEDGYKACSNRTFSDRLRTKGFDIIKSEFRYVYIKKNNECHY